MKQIVLALAVALLFSAGCTWPVSSPLVNPPDVPLPSPNSTKDPLKVHLVSGELLVLKEWEQRDSMITGVGTRYSRGRMAVERSRFETPLDSIALVEYRMPSGSRPSGFVGMAVWTVLVGITTVACVLDPKSCFGSCPTFYVDDGDSTRLVAEGFSDSIARVLEKEDVDALHGVRSDGGEFSLTMKNEALETHAVRNLTLVAARASAGGRIMATPEGRYLEVRNVRSPRSCISPEGDCFESLSHPDGRERISAADSTDLATRETIELTFDAGEGNPAIVLAARQSLMSTYLFYESLGFLGRQSGRIMADIERRGPEAARQTLGMGRLIGRIEFQVLDGNQWRSVGAYSEAGPLATQYVVIPIGGRLADSTAVSIRVIAPKGAWRIDWVAVADGGREVPVVELEPRTVFRDGVEDDEASASLRDSTRHLITYPGDTFRITWTVPSTGRPWDLFLKSEGYYYEWMRQEWVESENLGMAAMVYHSPEAALRMLAPGYKAAEPLMESRFWSSKFGN